MKTAPQVVSNPADSFLPSEHVTIKLIKTHFYTDALKALLKVQGKLYSTLITHKILLKLQRLALQQLHGLSSRA